MWILESDGDVFHGKRLWLRPGKKFIFGRTQTENASNGFVISDKTISRQHLTVEVSEVTADDCGNLNTRSKVTVTDLNTKIGTQVNGVQIRGKSHVLESNENEVALGRHQHHFRFTWVPLTLTFSFTTKERNADAHIKLYDLLGPLDIKVIFEYETSQTTHLASKKRNTPKGLQALIDGKFIVYPDVFVEAIVNATTPVGDGPSPLEEDFEANFPDALQFLPPRGEEPTQRDGSAYAPNPDRQNMFEGYSFVFYERRQFDNLLPPITQGRGKAYLREVIVNETRVVDFVRYVKELAGEKGLGEFDDGSEGKGVAVVRYNPVKGSDTEWYANFSKQVALHLDHRLAEQNEFLDAILGNNASALRRPLEVEMSSTAAPPSTDTTSITQPPPRQPQSILTEEPPAIAPARRGRSRRTPASRFRGFNDDDDFGPPSASVADSIAPSSMPADQSQSQGLFVSQGLEDHDMIQHQPPAAQNSRKRSAPIEEEDITEILAPAATALKKRRLAEEDERRRRGEEPTPPPPPPAVVKKQPITTKKTRKNHVLDIDVVEVAHQQRQKAEELARGVRDESGRNFDTQDIEAIRDLAIVEEMEVKRMRTAPRNSTRADESERWDDNWNGRKDFKKFRRRGVTDRDPKAASRVIVRLEEAKKKDFGIGDDYWLDSEKISQKSRSKANEKETQDGIPSQTSRARKNAAVPAKKPGNGRRQGNLGGVSDLSSDSDADVFEPTPSRTQRSQTLVDKTNKSQNIPAGNKRSAPANVTKPPPAKRQRQPVVRVEESEDSDDDDGLRFKFKRR